MLIQEFERLIFTKIETLHDKTVLRFYSTSGEIFDMYHEQDCCEKVYLDDVCGDLEDLLNTPIIKASEVCNHKESTDDLSCTWTFYIIVTKKGTVTLRWYGESNGYYSEKVSIKKANRLFS